MVILNKQCKTLIKYKDFYIWYIFINKSTVIGMDYVYDSDNNSLFTKNIC